MPNIDDFFKRLKDDLVDQAKQFGEEVRDGFIEDGKAFAEEAKDDLKRWVQLLAEDKLTKEDFKFLVNGKKSLARMEALKQKGLAKARLDKYREAILNTVIGAGIKLLK